jgi:hypothetical protein
MENAKHIGCMWALAVALGVGMAIANTPAVASAAPADSGKGSSSSDSSPSSSSGHSGSRSSDKPSAKSALSATNDAPSGHRRAHNPSAETAASSSGGPQTTPSTSTSSTGRAGATPETPGTAARQRGGASSRPGSGSASEKTSPNPAVVNTAATDPTTRGSSRVFTRHTAGVSSFASTRKSVAATPVAALAAAPTSSAAVAPAMAPRQPASKVITPTPADPVSHLVSTLINAVLSPFANSAPTAPAQEPGAWTMLAFARREFGQTSSSRSTTVNPPAGQTTNGLVTNTVGATSQGASAAADPGFISSTRNVFGLFSITSAADPDDNNYVAVVISTPFFTDILTSGTDPEDNLGFGAASIGVPGQTVNTFLSPFLNFTIAIPVTDPFAELFTELIRLGIV